MRLVLALGALALAACSQPAPQTAGGGCNVSASTPWRPLSGVEFTIEANAIGPDCEHAVATVIVRAPAGEVLWAEAHIAEHIMVLAPAHDPEAMRTALAEWIDPARNTTMQTTSALPEWPANQDAPQSGEFPFYPEEGYDRDAYNTLRTNNLPLLCYVQGMESLACLALTDGQLAKVGVQLFPG